MNSATKNNVSGKPPSSGTFSKGSGGQGTSGVPSIGGTSSVASARASNAYTNGGVHNGKLGDQNSGYGDGPKFPTTTGPEVSLEDSSAGGALQGSGATTSPKAKVK